MKKEEIIKILENYISPKFPNLIWTSFIESIAEEIINKMNEKN